MQHEFESGQMLVLTLKNLHLESDSTKTIAGNSLIKIGSAALTMRHLSKHPVKLSANL